MCSVVWMQCGSITCRNVTYQWFAEMLIFGTKSPKWRKWPQLCVSLHLKLTLHIRGRIFRLLWSSDIHSCTSWHVWSLRHGDVVTPGNLRHQPDKNSTQWIWMVCQFSRHTNVGTVKSVCCRSPCGVVVVVVVVTLVLNLLIRFREQASEGRQTEDVRTERRLVVSGTSRWSRHVAVDAVTFKDQGEK